MTQQHKKISENKTAINAVNQTGRNAIQLMDNRPISSLQQKLSTIQKKNTTDDLENNLTDEGGLETNENPNSIQLKTTAVSSNEVIQLGKAKNKKKINQPSNKIKKKKKYDTSPLSEYYEIKKTVNKKIASTKIYLQKVEKQLEDDEDIASVAFYRKRLNKFYLDTKETFDKIVRLPPSQGRLRSQTVERDKLAKELHQHKILLFATIVIIRKTFPMNAGGFGAKGRAHEMDADVNPAVAPFAKPLNNHYFQNLTLNGISPNVNVYKNSATAGKQKMGPFQVLGTSYSNKYTASKSVLLNNVDESLGSINTPQNVTFRDTPVGKGRGDGQYKNMANTNAAGYAWLLGRVGNQRWEWLHIRGAGLGGKTDSSNLVAGVRDANTHMIPYESNIRHLGTAVKNHATKYSKLNVIWSVSGQVAKYAYKTIRIKWTLFNQNKTQKATGDVSFKPLDTTNNISKNEVNKIENLLSEIRNGL